MSTVRLDNKVGLDDRNIRRSFVCFFLAILAVSHFWRQLGVNVWTIRAVGNIVNSEIASTELQTPPRGVSSPLLWKAQYLIANGNPEIAVTVLEGQPKLNPLEHYLLGKSYQYSKRPQEAIKRYSNVESWWSLVELGRIVEAKGEYEIALEAYRAAYSLAPEASSVLLAKFHWIELDDPFQAEMILENALSVYPQSSFSGRWLVLLGDVLMSNGRYFDASLAYLEGLSSPDHAWRARIGLAWALYRDGGSLEASREEMEMALADRPNAPEAYIALGDLLREAGELSEADEMYQHGLQQVPNNETLWLRRGEIALQNGNIATAIEIMLRAGRKFPTSARVRFILAQAYVEKGMIGAAIVSIEDAIELLSAPDEWYFILAGRIYEESGLISEATRAYRAALEIDAGNDYAKSRLSYLDNRQ